MPSVLHAACRNYSCGLLFATCLSHERTWGILFKSRYTNVRIIIIIIIGQGAL